MGKFKMGNRVRVVNLYSYERQLGMRDGHICTVVRTPLKEGGSYFVRLDNEYPGLENTGCWNTDGTYEMEERQMGELVTLPWPIPAAIAEYHDACAAFESAQLAVEKAKARIEDARLALKEAL